jgi:hypothetical protein
MEPGMWWMLALHMHITSFLNTPSHPVYYAEVKARVVRHNMDSTKSNTLLMETVEINDRQVRIRCYLAEHVRMLQTMFFYVFGIGPRQRDPGAAATGRGLLCAVPNGTHVNLITRMSRTCDYGETFSGWSRWSRRRDVHLSFSYGGKQQVGHPGFLPRYGTRKLKSRFLTLKMS